MSHPNDDNRTEWSPIWSVIMLVTDQKNWKTAKWESNLSIMSIRQQEVLLRIIIIITIFKK